MSSYREAILYISTIIIVIIIIVMIMLMIIVMITTIILLSFNSCVSFNSYRSVNSCHFRRPKMHMVRGYIHTEGLTECTYSQLLWPWNASFNNCPGSCLCSSS